jgi:hypothetical protein
MTNETPSNKTPQTLTFSGYINKQIQEHEEILPKVNRLAKKTIDTSLDILRVIETLDPEKPDAWYKKASAIVDAVMAANSGLDPQEVTTAVAYDMESLFRGFKPLNVGR